MVVSFVVVVVAVAGGDVGDCGCDYTIDCAVPFPFFSRVCGSLRSLRVQIYPLCWSQLLNSPSLIR